MKQQWTAQELIDHWTFTQEEIALVLSEKEWLNKMQPEDFRGLTPLFYGHITPYGEFQLDMNKRINIEGTI